MTDVTKAIEPKIVVICITFSSAHVNEIRFKGWTILSALYIIKAPLMFEELVLHSFNEKSTNSYNYNDKTSNACIFPVGRK